MLSPKPSRNSVCLASGCEVALSWALQAPWVPMGQGSSGLRASLAAED